MALFKNIDKNKGPNGPFLIFFCCILVLDISYHNQVGFSVAQVVSY
ncbi:hypothetical protein CPL00367_CDS0022 [Klebsiella phage HelplessSquare]